MPPDHKFFCSISPDLHRSKLQSQQTIPKFSKGQPISSLSWLFDSPKIGWLLFCFAICSCFCLWRFAVPGLAMAGLAVVSLIINFRQMSNREKSLWMLIFPAFFWLECDAIIKDRLVHRKEEQTHIQAEQDKFNSIAKEYQQTLLQMKVLYKLNNKIASLTQRNLDSITGRDSFAYIIPQTHAQTSALPLRIWNSGNQILTGVTVTIRNQNDFGNDAAFFNRSSIPVGTLSPHESRLLNYFIEPVPNIIGIDGPQDKNKIDSYEIEISAQNGIVYEVLQFKKNKYGVLPWTFRYWVTKMVPLPNRKNATGTKMMKRQIAWSDDLGDGMPTHPIEKNNGNN